MKDIFSDLYKKVLSFFNNEAKEENSKDTACNRLKLVLMQDRAKMEPALMEKMREEMIEVISKYVEIDKEALDLNLEAEGDSFALMLNIPVIRAKTREEIEKEEEERAAAEAKKAEEAQKDNNTEVKEQEEEPVEDNDIDDDDDDDDDDDNDDAEIAEESSNNTDAEKSSAETSEIKPEIKPTENTDKSPNEALKESTESSKPAPQIPQNQPTLKKKKVYPPDNNS